MPGTIQVSVLDFTGPQSSSLSSTSYIKVSMGPREHQTWNKGDFSFPLTTLRDSLIVTLQDAEGNEISRTGVDTRLVIEKGIWDDIFPLEGGGQVHMKLQFILTEEDRLRIRIMRESASKKKHDELLKKEVGDLEYVTTSGGSVASSFQPNHEASDRYRDTLSSSLLSPGFNVHLKELSHQSLVENSEIGASPIDVPVTTICSEEHLHMGSSGSASAAKNKIPTELNRNGANEPVKQSLPEKTPSNVRNMINAFESSLKQDMKPKTKPAPIKSQWSKHEAEVPLGGSQINEVNTEKIKPAQSLSRRVMIPFHTGDMQQGPTYFRTREEQTGFVKAVTGAASPKGTGQLEELRVAHIQTKGTNIGLKNKHKFRHRVVDIVGEETAPEDLGRVFAGERASASGRILNEQPCTNPCSNLFARKRHSNGNLCIKKSGKGTYPKGFQEVSIQGASGNEYYSSECSGAWIFPDEGRCLCITTGGKQMMSVIGGCWDRAKSQLEDMNLSVEENVKELQCCVDDGTGIEANEGEKTSPRLRRSEVRGSVDIETSRGPVGQVMRVAIMVGFATLVLLTRKKT